MFFNDPDIGRTHSSWEHNMGFCQGNGNGGSFLDFVQTATQLIRTVAMMTLKHSGLKLQMITDTMQDDGLQVVWQEQGREKKERSRVK